MKKAVLVSLATLFLVFQQYEEVHAQYTLRCEVVRVDSVGGPLEANVDMVANLYLNGMLVPPESYYTYDWYRRLPNLPGSQYEFRIRYTGYNGNGTHVYFDPESQYGLMDYFCILNSSLGSDTIRIPWWRSIVDQKLQSGVSFGLVRYWKENQFTSHHTVPDTFFTPRDQYNIVLLADTILNDSRTEKYYYWSVGNSWNNHYAFNTTSLFNKYSSRFNPTNSATLKTTLIDGNMPLGILHFKDPWHRDTVDQYGTFNRGLGAIYNQEQSPFTPNTNVSGSGAERQGVILGQDPNVNPTYYSIKIPLTQPMGGISSNFLGWETSGANLVQVGSNPPGYDEKAVVFTSPNAVVNGKYKAHRGSSLATATAPSSQRKLVKWGGYHHLVYPSGGNIWYVKSTNEGASWSQEERVSPTWEGNQNSNPAIDVDGLGNVFVVYEAPFLSYRAIVVKKRSSSGTWDPLWSASFLASSELKPVIAVSKIINAPKVVAVVQANGYTSSDPGLYYVHDGSLPVKVSETSASSLNPSLAYGNLVYQDNNVIYRKSITFTNPIVIGSREAVSTNYFNGRPLSNISNPSVAVREGGGLDFDSRPVIAWQATDLVFSTYRPIFVRHPVSGGIPPVFVLTVFNWATSNAHGKTPSVNVYQTPAQLGYQNPDVSVVWQDDPTDANGTYPNVVAANKISGNWGVQSTIATSSASSSVAQGDVSQTSSGGALIVRTGSSGPPYALTASERTNIGQIEGPMAKANSTSMDYARSVNVDLAGTGINGLRGVLTLYIRNAPRFGLRHLRELPSVQEDFLRLQTQSLIPDEISYVLSLCDVTIPRGIGNEQLRQRVCALQVSLNGRDFQTLGAITVNDLSALWNTRTSDTIRVVQREREFRVPAVGHVRFSVEPSFFNNPDHVVLIEAITLVDTSSTRLAKSASHEVLPQAFFLHPNYPNPFNPSTQIKFDLPEPSHVSLVVYDVLGRKVADLASGYREAGYHSSTWNAADQASGVYFARFNIINAEGKTAYAKVSKLVLTK